MGHGGGPVFGGPPRDCGFFGVDDGRYYRERTPRRERFEFTSDYTGTVMTTDLESMAVLYVVYEGGVGKELHVVPHFGPGKSMFETQLPALQGQLTASFENSGEGDRIAHLAHEGDVVLELNLSKLARDAGVRLSGY